MAPSRLNTDQAALPDLGLLCLQKHLKASLRGKGLLISYWHTVRSYHLNIVYLCNHSINVFFLNKILFNPSPLHSNGLCYK